MSVTTQVIHEYKENKTNISSEIKLCVRMTREKVKYYWTHEEREVQKGTERQDSWNL